MRIGVPRPLILTMAALFSGYHVVLGLYTITVPRDPIPVLTAMVVYGVVSALSLTQRISGRMPNWLAWGNVGAVIAMTLLIAPQLEVGRAGGLGYATWYVAAVGTLMTITSTRQRHTQAWLGTAFLVVHTLLWAGPGLLVTAGVIGSVAWVAISHILSRALTTASHNARRFAQAERQAADWQAAQDAHWNERQVRLDQTRAMAEPMLRVIAEAQGALSEAQKEQCLHLEAAIRDEIRGRALLNNAVRAEVKAARQRGASVTLLDEGGLDTIDAPVRERVLDSLARAISTTTAQRIIVRTAPPDSGVAVTVVGLTPVANGSARELGAIQDEHEDDDVDLWLEIPRR
jgi:hypothetical protein